MSGGMPRSLSRIVLLFAFVFASWSGIGFHPASADAPDVTYGSAVKLQHDKLKVRLHSHEVSYGSGSGQQSVTGFTGQPDDANDLWIIKCPNGGSCKQGDPISSGQSVRLQHMPTRKWLHSHLHASPLSNNYEVSAFGDDSQSDTGDHWKLEIDGKGKVWKQDQKVRLQHVDTWGYLHSHEKKYGRPIAGQHEVCGVQKSNQNSLWVATEGVYFTSEAA